MAARPLPFVKCADCGLLCYRDNEGIVREADFAVREIGSLRTGGTALPECTLRIHELTAECFDHGSDAAAAIRTVLSIDRLCGRHVKWIPGFAPKEHLEMLMSAQQLQEQKEHNDRMARREERWERRREKRQYAHERRLTHIQQAWTIGIALAAFAGGLLINWLMKLLN